MAKFQFQATEDMLIRLPPFIKSTDGTYILSGTNCVLTVVTPGGTVFAGSIDAPAQDANTGHWKSRIPVAEYVKGTWLIKATSSDAGTPLPQFREILWGEFDELTAIKAKTDNLPAIPASQGDVTALGSDITAIKAVTDALPAFPSDPADESALEAAITATETAIMTRLGVPTASLAEDLAAVAVNVGTTKTVVQELQTIAKGRWKIVGTQLLLYDALGSVLVRFNLFDDLGQPTNTRIYERVPV